VPDPEGVPYVCGKEPVRLLPAADTARPKQDSVNMPAGTRSEEQKVSREPLTRPVMQTPGKYYIVVKSQLPPGESARLADTLRAKGYPEAKVLQSNDKIRVVIFEALNREQANQKLAEAKKLYRDAWILVP